MAVVLFTSETARLAGLKSAESRRQSPLKAVPNGFKVVPIESVEPNPHVPTGESYREQRLARVRNQLDLIDCRLRTEAAKDSPNGQLLNWLAAAQERLSKQEQNLANRPLPGTLRPKQPGKSRSEPTAEPLPSEPEAPQG